MIFLLASVTFEDQQSRSCGRVQAIVRVDERGFGESGRWPMDSRRPSARIGPVLRVIGL